MSFSVLSWNVEHFKGGEERLKRVAAHIRGQDPDVFGLFEVENVDVLALMQNEFGNYTFGITDGPENMEILVGWRTAKFSQAMFTQKREFKAFNPSLRPGALLTVTLNSTLSNLLFLHTDSGTDAPGFGNRAEMFDHVVKMKKAIDEAADDAGGRLIVLGDLNTMGMRYPTGSQANERVDSELEIASIDRLVGKVAMHLLAKDEALTFNNLTLQSNLDHVLASTDLEFTKQGEVSGEPVFVAVRGWNQLTGAKRTNFIENISDHSSLFVEVA